MKFLLFFCSLILSGCTYSINMVHSNGQATDIIDENQKADGNIKATLPNIL